MERTKLAAPRMMLTNSGTQSPGKNRTAKTFDPQNSKPLVHFNNKPRPEHSLQLLLKRPCGMIFPNPYSLYFGSFWYDIPQPLFLAFWLFFTEVSERWRPEHAHALA